MRKKSKGGGEPIETWDGIFADPEVGRVLHANGLIADANKSSIEELATITSLSDYFNYNNTITQFPELQYCTGLSELIYAFQGCYSLTEVIIPDSVTDLSYTFNWCTGLVDAPDIPEGVTNMQSTFRYSFKITEAPIIPESVTNMNTTFADCYGINGTFIIKPVTPPTYSNTFDSVKVRTIYVPDESVDIYKTASGWSDHSSIIYPISQLPE